MPAASRRPSKLFVRSDLAFFHNDKTKEAIRALADPRNKRLVILCGAGATIDRTGTNWRSLIARAFKQQVEKPGGRVEVKGPESPAEFLANQIDSEAMASILTSFALEECGGDPRRAEETIREWVRQSLAEGAAVAGQPGRLSTTIARLAFLAASMGRAVVIVTTNYDAVIRDAVATSEELFRREAPVGVGDAVDFRYLSPADSITPDGLKAGTINLLHLHGHIIDSDPAAPPANELVLTETNYAVYRERSRDRLQELLDDPLAAFVSVGASLTDKPLIDALIRSKNEPLGPKYALVPVKSMGKADQDMASTLVDYVGRRGDVIGVNILAPDFHFQVGQFLQEVYLALSWGGGYAARRYGARLIEWWAEWSKLSRRKHADEVAYTKLRGGLDVIRRSYIELNVAKTREKLRLELWVRRHPTERNRTLVRWAASAWETKDHRSDPPGEIGLGPGPAAVKALVEGRPQHLDLDLDRNWRSFFAVPIWVICPPFAETSARSTSGLWVPVGVLQLASNVPRKRSAIGKLNYDWTHRLVLEMIRLGNELLDPEAFRQLLVTRGTA